MNLVMINTDEREIVLQLLSGSKKAFEQIFNMYHQRVYSFCLRLLCNTDTAEEITQNVFVALWDQRNKVDSTKLLAPYLFSIARYMIYREFRNKVYRKAAFEEISNTEISYKEITKDEVLFHELYDYLQRLIEKLPPRQKEIFRLSRDSRLTYKEIALHLGISENTVDTQIRRALVYMRKEYESYYKV